MKPPKVISLLIIIMISGFILTSNLYLGNAQSEIQVSGVISSDTTWTKVNSPYTLTGNVVVNVGATLTIEAGVTVNLNGYYLEADGALNARGTNDSLICIAGTSSEPSVTKSEGIYDKSGTIYLSNTNCRLEKAIISSASIFVGGVVIFSNYASPVINNITLIDGNIFVGTTGNLTIANSNIVGGWINIGASPAGNPVIFNNTIISPVLETTAGIVLEAGNATVSNNTISGFKNGIYSARTRYTAEVDYGQGVRRIEVATMPVFANNTIMGCDIGMYAESSEAIFSDNSISDCSVGIKVAADSSNLCIQNNLIINNNYGLLLLSDVAVHNNTISLNSDGIYIASGRPIIEHNNIYENSKYNIYSQFSDGSIYASNNWWGTTEQQAIGQSIYDFSDDPLLGAVAFTPFLIEPNPQAPKAPTITPTPSPTLTITPISTQSTTLSPFPSLLPTQTVANQHTMQTVTQVANDQTLTIIAAGIAILLIAVLVFTIKVKRNIRVK